MPNDLEVHDWEATLSRARRTVLFADVVESVRLAAADEVGTVTRWLRLAESIRTRLLAGTGGRVVKASGDGLLVEFSDPRGAAAAALRIAALARRFGQLTSQDRRLYLRMGVATGEVLAAKDDIYGNAVNLAARLMTLAGPNEIVVCDVTRDGLTDGCDADIEDLGLCHLRNLAAPQRAFRIGPPGDRMFAPLPAAANLRAVVAVMPLLPRRTPAELWSLGEVAAEEAIRGLSHAPGFAVISRLSTGALAGRGLSVSDLGAALGADYVVTGTFDVSGDTLRLNVELAEVGSSRVIWSESLAGQVDALFESDGMLIGELVSRIAGGIARCELDHARRAPMSSLKAYTLLLGAVTLLHRLSRRDFDFARSLLEALAERSPRQPLPLAWLANWHVMRVNQGWSDDPERDAQLARSACQRARDADPGCPLALTMEGAVNVNFLRRFDLAEASYDTALSIDPSTSLAWLLRAALRAFTDRGAEAVTDAHQALRLSPCDPHRFLYLSIAASAHLTAGEEAAALSLAEQSLKANRVHASTLRVKATAEWHLGLEAQARATTAELLRLVPAFTIDGYLSRSPATGSAVGGRVVEALRACGVPP